MLQLESFFSSSTLPWWFSEVCLSLQSGDGFPSGSCSLWNHSRPSHGLFTERVFCFITVSLAAHAQQEPC